MAKGGEEKKIKKSGRQTTLTKRVKRTLFVKHYIIQKNKMQVNLQNNLKKVRQ